MDRLIQLVVSGNSTESERLTRELLASGEKAEIIAREALIPAMDQVGDQFQRGERYLPDMLVAAKAMSGCMAVLKPALAGSSLEPLAKVVMGTVQGDLHDIGKNFASTVLEGAGFMVIDLGVDVAPEDFVEAVRKESPEFLGLSALLTTTMLSIGDTIQVLEKEGLRHKVKIMIGGAPVTQEFADSCGADFYAPDAVAGRDYARRIVSQK